MAKPILSSDIIVGYGNASRPSISGVPPAITDRVSAVGNVISPPGFSAPRMPLLERLTPRTLPATRLASTGLAKGRQIVTLAVKRTTNTAQGYVRALTMRR